MIRSAFVVQPFGSQPVLRVALFLPFACNTERQKGGTPLSWAQEEHVRLNVSHVVRSNSVAAQAGQTHRRKTLLGEIGLPDTVEKISSCAAVRFARALHAVSNCSAVSGKGSSADRPWSLDRRPFGDRHLRRMTATYAEHYHRERNHQGLANELIERVPTGGRKSRRIRRRQRLGGLLNYYCRAAS